VQRVAFGLLVDDGPERNIRIAKDARDGGGDLDRAGGVAVDADGLRGEFHFGAIAGCDDAPLGDSAEIQCKVEKNRHGGRGDCTLIYDHAMRLSEVDEINEAPY